MFCNSTGELSKRQAVFKTCSDQFGPLALKALTRLMPCVCFCVQAQSRRSSPRERSGTTGRKKHCMKSRSDGSSATARTASARRTVEHLAASHVFHQL